MAASQGDDAGSGGAPWTELLGSDHWSGLLDPLDPELRRLLLFCGDLCQVTYDSFNSDPHSAYSGSCRYSKPTLLRRTLFPAAADLSVAAYLYATSLLPHALPAGLFHFSLSREAWSRESNWIGYVAVSSDPAAAASGRRVIYVAWRGTTRTLEWVDVLEPEHVPLDPIPSSSSAALGGARDTDDDTDGRPKVMKGWHEIYTASDPKSPFSKQSARDQLLSAVRELMSRYAGESLSIVCTGHSLGATLAILSAYDMVESGVSKLAPVTAFVYGSPQVGNTVFRERLEGLPTLRVLRVKNKPDVIPLYPSRALGFVHAGNELVVDSRKSPFLKPSKDAGDHHNLQGMLHAVAGWNGEEGEFALQVQRSVALVNKSSAYLKDECLVPESWWVDRNKGMVVGADGEWQLAPPAEGDLPSPPTSGGLGGGGTGVVGGAEKGSVGGGAQNTKAFANDKGGAQNTRAWFCGCLA